MSAMCEGNRELCKTALFKIVNFLQMSQSFWYSAFFKLQGNEEDGAFRLFISYIQCELYLFLNKASFVDRLTRKTDDYYIRQSYSFADFLLPILSRQKVFLIKPGVNIASI